MPKAKPIEFFRFQFSGGMAAEGELNFYELGRSQYAAARLLYTLARYQETGKVVARISERTSVDIRARVPFEGSFIYEALQFAQQAVAPTLVSVPLNALFTMVWDHVLPTGGAWEITKAEASLERGRIEAKKAVSLSKEETRRLDITRQIVMEQEITKRDAIAFLRDVHDNLGLNPDPAMPRLRRVKLAIADLTYEAEREEILKPHLDTLQQISDEDRRKIFGKSRRLIGEIGLPLRSSSDEFVVGVGANDNKIGWMDFERAQKIAETDAEETTEHIAGQIIQFNKVSGYGKFQIDSEEVKNMFGAEINFGIPRQKRHLLMTPVLDAMKEEMVIGLFAVTRDKEGNPKYLELLELHTI